MTESASVRDCPRIYTCRAAVSMILRATAYSLDLMGADTCLASAAHSGGEPARSDGGRGRSRGDSDPFVVYDDHIAQTPRQLEHPVQILLPREISGAP